MGRPRKNADGVEAKQRLADAYWKLLEDYNLNEITVGMIAAEAQCNRGTLYYHYADIEDLTQHVIQSEFWDDKSVSLAIFRMISGIDDIDWSEVIGGKPMERLMLIIKRGGRSSVERSIKSFVFQVWQTLLDPDGHELDSRTLLLLEYSINGLLGVLTCRAQGVVEMDDEDLASLIMRLSSFGVSCISEFEGVSIEELRMRLRLFDEFSKIS